MLHSTCCFFMFFLDDDDDDDDDADDDDDDDGSAVQQAGPDAGPARSPEAVKSPGPKMTSPQPKLMHSTAKPAALPGFPIIRSLRRSLRHAVVTPPISFCCWQNGFILLEPPGFCRVKTLVSKKKPLKPLHLSVEQNPVPCYLSNLFFDYVPKIYLTKSHYMNHELT